MGVGPRKPPVQLPIVLQVMLSQSQRKEALELIAEFVSVLGSWAVEAVLGVDLFPYLSKLLRSNNNDLRWHLVVIWQRILSVDLSARRELIAEKGYRCFLSILEQNGPNTQELIFALFVLAVTCCGYREAQAACWKHKLVLLSVSLFEHSSSLVRQWAVLSLATLWADFAEAKVQGIQHKAHEKLCLLLSDPVPEVRASAAYCVGQLIRGVTHPELTTVELNLALTLRELTVSRDCPEASSLVRRQIAEALVGFASARKESFQPLFALPSGPKSSLKSTPSLAKIPVASATTDEEQQYLRVCYSVYKHLLFLEQDPDVAIAQYVSAYLQGERKRAALAASSSGGAGANTSLIGKMGAATSSSVEAGSSADERIANALLRSGEKLFLDASDEVEAPAGGPSTTTSSVVTSDTAADEGGGAQQPPGGSAPPASAALRDEHRVSADFFGSCCVAFRPVVEVSESVLLERRWRQERIAQNEARASAFVTSKQAKFRVKVGVVATPNVPSCVSWHPVLDSLVIGSSGSTSTSGQISWCHGVNISSIDHTFHLSGGVTSLTWVHPESSELLLAGSSETVVHLFRNPDCTNDGNRQAKQVAAWRPFVPAVGLRSPVITAWSTEVRSLFTSGNVPFIRVWDMERQYALCDLTTEVNAGVTALTNCNGGSAYSLIGGFASGSVKVFDPRVAPGSGSHMTKELIGLNTCVMGLRVPVASPNSVVGVSRDGQVRIWDVRAGSAKQCNPLRGFQSKSKSEVSASVVHNYAPIMVCGYVEQQIHVYNLNGEQLREIRYHEGFLEERIGPIAGLAFHPTKMVFAAASTDKYVSVFSNDN